MNTPSRQLSLRNRLTHIQIFFPAPRDDHSKSSPSSSHHCLERKTRNYVQRLTNKAPRVPLNSNRSNKQMLLRQTGQPQLMLKIKTSKINTSQAIPIYSHNPTCSESLVHSQNILALSGTGEMARPLRAHGTFAENQSSVLNTHVRQLTTTCNSKSGKS